MLASQNGKNKQGDRDYSRESDSLAHRFHNARIRRPAVDQILRQIPMQAFIQTEDGDAADRQHQKLRRDIDAEQSLSEYARDDDREHGADDFQCGSQKRIQSALD